MDYPDFIASKRVRVEESGFDISLSELNPSAFEWQRKVIQWALRLGRAALFEGCGLGKTIQQLEWAAQVCLHTGGNVIIHCPLGVRQQTLAEANRFGMTEYVPVNIASDQSEVTKGITICNYDRLHKFNTDAFVGAVLDEGQILKDYKGKTKERLLQAYCETPFRLDCSATPSPNTHMELGNHAEFLGVMPSNEMLARWFINDTMHAGNYRLRAHAEKDFWLWVSSWAMCLSSPADLGYPDDGYQLPGLTEIEHLVEDDPPAPPGQFWDTSTINATTIHQEKRRTAEKRAKVVADLVNADDDYWIVWCHTDYEEDALAKLIPTATTVRGSQPSKTKERNLKLFSDGETRVLITKPTIAGLGMNWQHCCQAAFVGMNYSYADYYQALRRILRFGQLRHVTAHIVSSDAELAASRAVKRKAAQHADMKESMAAAVRQIQTERIGGQKLAAYQPQEQMELPSWLTA